MNTPGKILLTLLTGAAMLSCQFANNLLQTNHILGPTPETVSTADWIIPVTGTGTVQPSSLALLTTPDPDHKCGTYFIDVYFTDRKRLQSHQPPYEIAVQRKVPEGGLLPASVLQEFFLGPTAAEQSRGLEAVTDGFTGFRAVEVENGVARVYLTGTCIQSNYPYTITQPLIANLRQFPEIQSVKIYDEQNQTIDIDGPGNSGPACLNDEK